MEILLDSFIFSYCCYFSPMCRFCSVALSQKREKIQERALRLFFNDSYSDHNSLVLKVGQFPMEVSLLRKLAIGVCKILNSFNPDFMNTYFSEGSHSGKNDLAVNMAETL